MKDKVSADADAEAEQGAHISRPSPVSSGSSNGRTAAFDAVNAGSTPAPETKRKRGRPPGEKPFDKKAHDRMKSAERRARLKAQKEAK